MGRWCNACCKLLALRFSFTRFGILGFGASGFGVYWDFKLGLSGDLVFSAAFGFELSLAVISG